MYIYLSQVKKFYWENLIVRLELVDVANVLLCQLCDYQQLDLEIIPAEKTYTDTAKNNIISPNFMVWKFCGKAQFPHSFGRFARNSAETAFPQNFHTMKLGEIMLSFAM